MDNTDHKDHNGINAHDVQKDDTHARDAMEKHGLSGSRPKQAPSLWAKIKTLLTRMVDEHFCTILSGGGKPPPKQRKAGLSDRPGA